MKLFSSETLYDEYESKYTEKSEGDEKKLNEQLVEISSSLVVDQLSPEIRKPTFFIPELRFATYIKQNMINSDNTLQQLLYLQTDEISSDHEEENIHKQFNLQLEQH